MSVAWVAETTRGALEVDPARDVTRTRACAILVVLVVHNAIPMMTAIKLIQPALDAEEVVVEFKQCEACEDERLSARMSRI